MKIGYRRFAGAIGVSPQEKGARGLWWEKRLALWELLSARGHQVIPLSRVTRESKGYLNIGSVEDVDVLMIEFGGTNKLFYGKDIEGTIEMARTFQGPVIYICDDPDLFPQWKWFEGCDFSKWTVWNNTPLADVDIHRPPESNTCDFPYGAIVNYNAYVGDWSVPNLAYIGRPVGRKDILHELEEATDVINVYGKPKEWESYPAWDVTSPPPSQPERADFYAQHLGCLLIADKRHKKMQWRTGRFYHAIAGGCPVIVERDHEYFSRLKSCTFLSCEELLQTIVSWVDEESISSEERRAAYDEACGLIKAEYQVAIDTLERQGL